MFAMKIKFTSSKVKSFPIPPRGKNQIFYWDTDTVGLSVRVTINNNRAYIFQSKVFNRSIRMTIGDIKSWSLDDARKEARRLQNLCDQGKDPRRIKNEEAKLNHESMINRKLNKITLNEAYQEYLESRKSIWSERTYEDAVKISQSGGKLKKIGEGHTQPGALFPLLNIPLASLKSNDLVDWLAKENLKHKTIASLAFRILRAFINWCSEHDIYNKLISPEIYKSKSVRELVHRVTPKTNSLEKAQLKTWFKAVDEINNIVHRSFLKICLLVGARSEALRSLKYSDVDFKWKSIKIWNKGSQSFIQIPLTPYVEYLINNIPSLNQKNYIFSSSKSKTGYIVDVRKQYHRALKKHSLPLLTIHDLRRSFSNLSEWVSVPIGVTENIMGHSPKTLIEKHYKNRPLDLLRLHHKRIEKWILDTAEVDISFLKY